MRADPKNGYKTYVMEDGKPVLDVSPEDMWTNLNIARDVAVKGYLSELMSGVEHVPGRLLCVVRGSEVIDTFNVEAAEWENA